MTDSHNSLQMYSFTRSWDDSSNPCHMLMKMDHSWAWRILGQHYPTWKKNHDLKRQDTCQYHVLYQRTRNILRIYSLNYGLKGDLLSYSRSLSILEGEDLLLPLICDPSCPLASMQRSSYYEGNFLIMCRITFMFLLHFSSSMNYHMMH